MRTARIRHNRSDRYVFKVVAVILLASLGFLIGGFITMKANTVDRYSFKNSYKNEYVDPLDRLEQLPDKIRVDLSDIP